MAVSIRLQMLALVIALSEMQKKYFQLLGKFSNHLDIFSRIIKAIKIIIKKSEEWKKATLKSALFLQLLPDLFWKTVL